MPFSAVLDACVLHPIHLVDTLLRCAEANLYRPLWSPDILAELRRSLIREAGRTEAEADRRINEMTQAFTESLVEDYQAWIPHLANHHKDRHVLAAAIHSGAETIVTANLRHFPPTALAPYNITAQSPDSFLCKLFVSDSELLTSLVQRQAGEHTKPPISVVDLLERLNRTVPRFTDQVRVCLLADQL